MAASKQNRNECPHVLIADARHPETALKQVRIHQHTPNAFQGVCHTRFGDRDGRGSRVLACCEYREGMTTGDVIEGL